MTSRRAPALAAVLAAAVAACGPSKESKLMHEREATCNGLLAQGEVTFLDALQQLGSPYQACVSPSASVMTATANDRCGGATVHQIIVPFDVTDPGLCHTGTGGGCGFYCELRITDQDWVASGGTTSALVCASQWFGGVCSPSTNWCPYYLC